MTAKRAWVAIAAAVVWVAGCTGDDDPATAEASPSVTATEDTLAAPGIPGPSAGASPGGTASEAPEAEPDVDAAVPRASDEALHDLVTAFDPEVDGVAAVASRAESERAGESAPDPATVDPHECVAMALAESLHVEGDLVGAAGADDLIVRFPELVGTGPTGDEVSVELSVRILESPAAARAMPASLLAAHACEGYAVREAGRTRTVDGVTVRLARASGLRGFAVVRSVASEAAQGEGDDAAVESGGTVDVQAAYGRCVLQVRAVGLESERAQEAGFEILRDLVDHLRAGSAAA